MPVEMTKLLNQSLAFIVVFQRPYLQHKDYIFINATFHHLCMQMMLLVGGALNNTEFLVGWLFWVKRPFETVFRSI